MKLKGKSEDQSIYIMGPALPCDADFFAASAEFKQNLRAPFKDEAAAAAMMGYEPAPKEALVVVVEIIGLGLHVRMIQTTTLRSLPVADEFYDDLAARFTRGKIILEEAEAEAVEAAGAFQ